MKKIISRAFASLIVLFFICLIVLSIVFHRELKALNSLNQRSPGVYTMKYKGDYGFDEFLETGARSDKDIEAFVTKRLLKGLPIKINVRDAGCTAFVSRNEKGEVIFARNFDFSYAPFVQLITKPKNGYASISTVNLSYAGYTKDNLPSDGMGKNDYLTLAAPFLPFDGMNEKGVCIALLAVPESEPAYDSNKVTLNTTTAIRLVLDKAANIDEAVDLLRQYNIYFSGGVNCHFLIADASGDSVLVEYFDGDLQAVKAETDYQIASNFIAYNGVNIGEGYTEFERYDAVEKVLKEKQNIVTMDDCENILNSVGIMDGCTDKLQWSVVYNPSKLTGKIWPHRDSSAAWDF